MSRRSCRTVTGPPVRATTYAVAARTGVVERRQWLGGHRGPDLVDQLAAGVPGVGEHAEQPGELVAPGGRIAGQTGKERHGRDCRRVESALREDPVADRIDVSVAQQPRQIGGGALGVLQRRPVDVVDHRRTLST